MGASLGVGAATRTAVPRGRRDRPAPLLTCNVLFLRLYAFSEPWTSCLGRGGICAYAAELSIAERKEALAPCLCFLIWKMGLRTGAVT